MTAAILQTPSASGPAVAGRVAPCFVNPWVDAGAVGGLSILALGVLLVLPVGNVPEKVSLQFMTVGLLVNFPHYSATLFRLYQNGGHMRQFPRVSFLLPLLTLGVLAAGLALPAAVIPYVALVYLLWSPYHYSGQTIGVTMIYARRNGIFIDGQVRRLLKVFVYASCATRVLRTVAGGSALSLFGTTVPVLWAPHWLLPLALAVSVVAGLGFAFLVLRRCIGERRRLPLVMLVPAAAHAMWFIPDIGLSQYAAIAAIGHCLQYLFIAWAMQLKQKMDGDGIPPSRRYVAGESLRWYLANIIGGAALFVVAPYLIHQFSGIAYASVFTLCLSLINIHHFFVDGVIWKLRNPRNANPLLASLGELTGMDRGAAAGAPAR